MSDHLQIHIPVSATDEAEHFEVDTQSDHAKYMYYIYNEKLYPKYYIIVGQVHVNSNY